MTLDCIMGIVLMTLMGYVYHEVENEITQQVCYVVGIGLLVIIIVDFVRGIKKSSQLEHLPTRNKEVVHRVCLLDEMGVPVKKWELFRKNGLLIGRGNSENPVDIDLGRTEYGALIKEEHAVLNYVRGSWYIENLDSENDVKIQKRLDGETYQLASGHPLRIVPGDILILAKTTLEVW